MGIKTSVQNVYMTVHPNTARQIGAIILLILSAVCVVFSVKLIARAVRHNREDRVFMTLVERVLYAVAAVCLMWIGIIGARNGVLMYETYGITHETVNTSKIAHEYSISNLKQDNTGARWAYRDSNLQITFYNREDASAFVTFTDKNGLTRKGQLVVRGDTAKLWVLGSNQYKAYIK